MWQRCSRAALASSLGSVLLGACAFGPPPDCSDALRRVQEYQAPGDRGPLFTNLMARLANDPRPVDSRSWAVGKSQGDECSVELRLTRGSEEQVATWWYQPKSGQVRADNDLAKQLSGWE